MERQSASVWVILMVIGVALFIVAVFPFARTDTFLDETHTIPAYSHYWMSYNFAHLESPIHITISVSGGAVDFWAMDESGYNDFENGQDFYYYTAPSRMSISSATIDWIPPQNEKVYFVWNNLSPNSKSVSMSFSHGYISFLPGWARFVIGAFGGILIVSGLSKVRQHALKGIQKTENPDSNNMTAST